MPPRALTGIKPTGAPHVGNLLGAIRPALDLQSSYEAYYFIASYHALTTTHNAEDMRKAVLEVASTWLALGLDPARTCLFNQHDVPEVTELAWILSCVTGKGMLDKAHAFKDAEATGRDINVGIYTYPVLMAADILIFDSDVVPVGKDQKQHVEIARDIALRFNHQFGDTLKLPQPLIRDEVATIPGLDGRKMSKSYENAIEIFLPPKQLRKKLMTIQTDSTPMGSPLNPDTCNVFALYKLFATAEQTADLASRYRAGSLGYGHAKQELFEVMDVTLAESRERYFEFLSRPTDVREILEGGAARARAVARTTVDRVRNRVGV